jgi:hypothetical protein
MTMTPGTLARVSAVVLGLFVMGASRVALACPTCAGDAGNNLTFLKLGALMCIVPFSIVGTVLWVLRHAPSEEQ